MLRGGDRAIDVVVIDPDIKVTEHDASKTEGHITFKATKEGKLIIPSLKRYDSVIFFRRIAR